ncbi:MAG: segregation/condensation protein A, partial [Sandaracinaceae bacterium]
MSETSLEPLDPDFQISLPDFEGPLDLLLHLIRKHELDILDLPIAFVTERYLQYVTLMEKLDLDIASEYLVMAATLAHIKSKMLLPQEPDDQDDEEPEDEIDPRAELIRRLLEYQKYKVAAEQLGSRPIPGRDVFGRGSEAPRASGPPPLASTSLFKLLDAFNSVLKRAQADLAFEITPEGVSIQDRMRQLTDVLRERREVRFEDLFEENVTVYDLVITFMAILEMAKRRLVKIYQSDAHSPIHLRSTVVSEDDDGEDERDQPSAFPRSEGGDASDDAAPTPEPEAQSSSGLELGDEERPEAAESESGAAPESAAAPASESAAAPASESAAAPTSESAAAPASESAAAPDSESAAAPES